MSEIVLRDLAGMAEFKAAEALQRAVWGDGDKEDPADLMMVIASEGGLVAGAFGEGKLLGYVFGFPTRHPEIQHSHRLAVLPEARGLGLGVQLKFFQRSWCLSRGIRLVRWTFDPMRLANAALNIGRLGGRSSTYHADYYGEMAGINAGVPSDRLLVDWHLDDPVVAARATGLEPPQGAASIRQSMPLPADFGSLLTENPALAMDLRLKLRDDLANAFADGLEICGFDTATRCYQLRRKTGPASDR